MWNGGDNSIFIGFLIFELKNGFLICNIIKINREGILAIPGGPAYLDFKSKILGNYLSFWALFFFFA